MESILFGLSSIVTSAILKGGYLGIAALMALESANIPIPSEIVMPFSGFLAFEGKLNLLLVVLAGASGNLAGSLVSYYLGFFGGRAWITRWGRFLFITSNEVDLAERWFQKYGMMMIFVARVLPIVRTFISFPAGIARMNIWKFSVYTFFGSLIWSFVLAYGGVIMGENWKNLEGYVRRFDWAILALFVFGIVWWVWRHVKNIKHE